MDGARVISIVAMLFAAACFIASGLQPAFIAFYGALFIVGALFHVETLSCLLLLPSMFHREKQELIPLRERNGLLVGDMFLLAGAVWCVISPAVRGMHSYWGLLAMLAGTMILSIRTKSRTTDRLWLRWVYFALTMIISVACMMPWKPHAYWVSLISLVLIMGWFRFNRYVDKR